MTEKKPNRVEADQEDRASIFGWGQVEKHLYHSEHVYPYHCIALQS